MFSPNYNLFIYNNKADVNTLNDINDKFHLVSKSNWQYTGSTYR